MGNEIRKAFEMKMTNKICYTIRETMKFLYNHLNVELNQGMGKKKIKRTIKRN